MRPSRMVAVLVVSGLAVVGASAQTPPTQPRGVLPPQPQTPRPATASAPAAPVPSTPAAQAPAQAAPTTAARAAAALVASTPQEAAPAEATLGAPVYPNAAFLGSFDAGLGQRYYLYGSTAAYAQVLQFYRTALKSRGDEVFDIPPIWSFDIGRYREQTMAYPPSVTVRDHATGGGKGYLHAGSGPEGQRFATVIQIVPPAPGEARR